MVSYQPLNSWFSKIREELVGLLDMTASCNDSTQFVKKCVCEIFFSSIIKAVLFSEWLPLVLCMVVIK